MQGELNSPSIIIEFHNVNDHFLEYIKVTLYEEGKPDAVYGVRYIRNPENTSKLPNIIAQDILNMDPLPAIIGIDLPGYLVQDHRISRELIYSVARLTGHPVLYIPKLTAIKSFKNILMPVTGTQVCEFEFQKFSPLLKFFNSNIYLLRVNITQEECIADNENTGFKKQKKYFLNNTLLVKSVCINHQNEAETILAYASIIQADLIFNSLNISRFPTKKHNTLTWQFLIQHSKFPLFNYIK